MQNFWKAIGGWPVRMTPEVHDDLVSRSSHLPHVVAAELANYVLSPAHPKEQALVCANGFRDTTRIASGSTEMWRDIVLANRKNLGRVLGVFIEDLQEFQLALEREDVHAIEEFFANAKQRRDHTGARTRPLPRRSRQPVPQKPRAADKSPVLGENQPQRRRQLRPAPLAIHDRALRVYGRVGRFRPGSIARSGP